jgi:hypothetical protein
MKREMSSYGLPPRYVERSVDRLERTPNLEGSSAQTHVSSHAYLARKIHEELAGADQAVEIV